MNDHKEVTTEILGLKALKSVFPNVRHLSDLVLVPIINEVANAFFMEIEGAKNYFAITFCRRERFVAKLVFGGEIVECECRIENIDGTGIYPEHMICAISITGNCDFVELLRKRMTTFIKETALETWREKAIAELRKCEQRVPRSEIMVHYGLRLEQAE